MVRKGAPGPRYLQMALSGFKRELTSASCHSPQEFVGALIDQNRPLHADRNSDRANSSQRARVTQARAGRHHRQGSPEEKDARQGRGASSLS